MSIYLAGEVAYYGYLYAMIKDRKRFQIATGCAKAATLSGSCVSGIIGQLVVSLNGYSTLTYYSFVGSKIIIIIAVFQIKRIMRAITYFADTAVALKICCYKRNIARLFLFGK